MKLSRSSFYYRPKAKGRDWMKAEADLLDRIEAICLEFPRYGYRRVTHQLKHEGWQVNHKKVLRLMRESDLLCRVKRRWVRTTDSNHYFPRYSNLIKGMVIDQLNQVWLSDITYIRIRTGFVYLAAILDAFSRKVIGYAVSMSLDTSLTLATLRMAIARRKPGPVSSIIRIRGYSMLQVNMWMSSRAMAFWSVWRARAIPMRMPGWRAFSRHSNRRRCIYGSMRLIRMW
jgi:transposase InsO family protein